MRSKTDPTRAIDMHVGKQLRVLRSARGYTQEDLAKALGISYQQLHKYETGSNSIAVSRLYELSKFLNVSPDTFFEGLNGEAPQSAKTNVSLDAPLLDREQMQMLKYLSGVSDSQRSALLGFIKHVVNE